MKRDVTMKKLNDLGIELVKKNYRSDFLHDMLEEELAGLIAGKKFLNRSLNFIINYIYRNDNDVEFGLFIINKSHLIIPCPAFLGIFSP